jgi:TPR repeat protein
MDKQRIFILLSLGLACALPRALLADERAVDLWNRISVLYTQDEDWLKKNTAAGIGAKKPVDFNPFQRSPYFDELTKKENLLEQLAEDGDTTAQYYEGVLNLKVGDRANGPDATEAQRWSARMDFQRAIRWLRPLADAGNPNAQRTLAEVNFDGKGISKSSSNAIDWYFKAEEGFRKAGDRKQAVITMDKMREIDPSGPLTKRAYEALFFSQ